MDQAINDIINGLFELSGGMFLWLNVMSLYKAKCVKGVSIYCFAFFAVGILESLLLSMFKSMGKFDWSYIVYSGKYCLDHLSFGV